MQEMKIQGIDLLVKELNGKRVVTFKDVDTVHRRPEGTARKAQVSPHSIGNWCAGVTLPLLQNRINICVALGKDEDFLTPKRKRNVR